VTLTRRADLVRDQLAHPPLGTRRAGSFPVRAGISGTGDDLLVLAWTAAELARERAAGTRLLRRLGVEPGMRVANALPGALATPGSLLLGDVVEELGGLDVPVGEVDGPAVARQAWELFDRVRPDVLVVGDARALFAATPPASRPWWRGIVWLQAGAASPALSVPAEAGFSGWQRTWLAVPEVTSFVAASCAASRLHAEAGVAVVDPATGSDVPAGDAGTLVVTGPDLRYATGLAARIVATPCACGEPGTIVELA
jgi:hypothetical protein